MQVGVEAKISVNGLTYSYDRGGPDILRDINLHVRPSEFLTIVGASGCGKSTLLNIIAGLLGNPDEAVRVDGEPVRGPSPERAMVFQDDAVFPWYTVRQNVEYGLKLARMPAADRARTVDEYLAMVGLAHAQHLYPRQLSGGMRKRVDIARAICTKPDILLMDEPFAALDVITKSKLQEHFLQLWQMTTMTVLFVTHDLEEALFMADRIVVLSSHPGTVLTEVEVDFGRPRTPDMKTQPDFQKLRGELARLLDGSETA